MINFEWYRTFTAIYQCGTLTKAAQELAISQPNVSVHLASLEHYVGGRLFDRLPRKMIPTELGKKLYTQIVGSIENLTAVENTFSKKYANALPSLRLGSPYEYFQTCLASEIDKIPCQLNVTFGIAKDLISQLANGELDIVIASQITHENKNIVYKPILVETFIIAANIDLDTSEFEKALKDKDYRIAEKWLLKQQWLAYSTDLAFIRRFWLKNFNKRPSLTPKFIIPNLNIILTSISSNNGISVVSDYLAQDFIKEKKVKMIWDGIDQATNTIYAAYDKTKLTASKIEAVKILTGLISI